MEPKLSKAVIMVAKELIKAGLKPEQGMGNMNQGRSTIMTLKANKDGFGLGYVPTRKDRQQALEARRQRTIAKLKGERMPKKKMIIPHIRTTFPTSAMLQSDREDEDELALPFADELSINAAADDEFTTPPLPDGRERRDLDQHSVTTTFFK